MENSFCLRVIKTCEKYSHKIAMRVVGDDSEVYTFGELLQQSRAVAFQLKQQSIVVGDKVALIGDNHPCWEIAYLGTLFAGAVCVPLDPHGEIETLTNFLENSEAKFAFLSPDFTEKFRQIEEKLGREIPAAVWRMHREEEQNISGDEEKMSVDESSMPNTTFSQSQNPKTENQKPKSFQFFEDWINTDFPENHIFDNPPVSAEDTALLIYTSGTTGTPKGVPLTHGNIIAELDGIYEVIKLTDQDRILSLLPLFHVYLQIINLWVATTYACEVGYLQEMTPAELSEALKSFKPTLLTTVPRLWYLFHKKIFDAIKLKSKAVQLIFGVMFAANGFLRTKFNINLGSKLFGQVHESFGGNLHFAITAGSRFDESVAVDFYKLGFTIIQGYGLTETSGAATATYEDDNCVGSVGKPFINAEIRLDNQNAEGVGEVLIKGGMVFKGYYKNEAATREVFTADGFFRTGDLGKLDSEGNLFIVGRSKDVIVLPNGKNIHPEDLEVQYLKSPLVEELAILGVKDESSIHAGAEKLVAVAVPNFEFLKRQNIAGSREAIRFDLDNLGRELPEYQRVHEYIITGEPLPRTATKKIKRFALQKLIESGAFSAVGSPEKKPLEFTAEDRALINSPVGQTVISILKTNSEAAEAIDEIHPAMNLELDFGLDSLARAEVFAALEQNFSLEFAGEDVAKTLTVRDIIELINKNTNSNFDNSTTGGMAQSKALNWSQILQTPNEEIKRQFPELQFILRDRSFFHAFSFSFFRCFNLVCRILFRLEVSGAENFKNLKKPYLICPNHQSYIDAFVVSSNYSFDVFKNSFYVGASMYFQNFLVGKLAQMLNVVPIDADTQLMKAMKAGAIGLRNGKILNIYPEGERSFEGRLHSFKKGAAILATELDVPIVPVAIDGLYNVWARNSWRIRLAKVKICFGQPFYAKDIIDPETDDETKYEIVTEHLKNEIKQMLDGMRR